MALGLYPEHEDIMTDAYNQCRREGFAVGYDKAKAETADVVIEFARYFTGERIEYNRYAGTYKELWDKSTPVFQSIKEAFDYFITQVYGKV